MSRYLPSRRVLTPAALTLVGVLVAMGVPARAATPVVHATVRADQGASDGLEARLDAAIQRTMRQAGIPGAIVEFRRPGMRDYVRAFGIADTATGEPVDQRMNMRIGSETKTFTVTALLELVDCGLVGLDTPISAYVPGVPDGDHITLRELAEMRSGLFDYTSDPEFVTQLLQLSGHPDRSFTPQQLLAFAFRHWNTAPPGTEFDYNNTNFVLLGLVIEKVTGQNLADFLREHVADPSGLEHTFLPRGAEFPRPRAHGYTDLAPTGARADATVENPSWAWAAGAMISNLDDMVRWTRVAATGTQLTPATQAERLKALPTSDAGISYGLGIFDDNGWVGHTGALPGYECVSVFLPEQQAIMVALVNTNIAPPQGQHVINFLAEAITNVATPAHVWAPFLETHVEEG